MAGPRGRKTGEHRVPARLLSLFIARAIPFPVELRPGVAFLGLDAATELDALARELHEKARWRVHVGVAEERPAPSVREVHPILGARDPDVAKAALFLELGFAAALDRAGVRKHPFFHPGHEDDREFKTFDGVHRDERRRWLRVLVFVHVGHERDLLEKARELFLQWERDELLGERPELLDVRPALLSLFRPILEIRLVPGERCELVQEPRQRELLGRLAQPCHDPPKRAERVLLPLGDRGDQLRLRERVTDAQLVLARARQQRRTRLVAQTARRRVQHACERERIMWILDQPQVRERVLHLATLVEGAATDDLVRQSEPAERVLDRSRLRVRAVEDGDITRAVRLALALQAFDLARDELGLVRLVVRLHHDDVGATLPVGPELLLLARRVVAHDRMRGVENPLGRAVVLLELDDLGVRIIALEVEDVADVGAAPAEDRLVVVSDHPEVLAEPREISEEHVLRAVRVLVFVDEDVLVAVLPPLERRVAGLEKSAREEQQVVEVDGVVLSKELVVPLPDDRGDTVELALWGRTQVGWSFELVLRPGDHRGDRAGREDPLAGVRVGHRLADDGALVGLVVNGERTVDPDGRPFAAQEARAEGMERPDRELGQALLSDQPIEPLAHFTRGLVRKGDGEDRVRRDPEIPNQVRDAVRQDPRLSRSGAGEDEQRAVPVGHGLALLRIQGIEDRVGHRLDATDGGALLIDRGQAVEKSRKSWKESAPRRAILWITALPRRSRDR